MDKISYSNENEMNKMMNAKNYALCAQLYQTPPPPPGTNKPA